MLATDVHVTPPSTEYSQLRILPVNPFNVSEPLFVPAHTVSPPETAPPTVAGNTEIVDTAE